MSKFNIRFVSPLLLHGANSRELDKDGLPAKAFRAGWRFWFRAIMGGIIPKIKPEDLAFLEGMIFGAADSQTGPAFRMIVDKNCSFFKHEPIFLGFKRNGADFNSRAFLDPEYAVTISPRKSLTEDARKKAVLFAAIRLWAALGSMGQRARRGFGSPVLIPDQSDPALFGRLPMDGSFADRDAVVKHLSEGLNAAWSTCHAWVTSLTTIQEKKEVVWAAAKGYRLLPGPASDAPSNLPYFILRSPRQISVADKPYDDWDQMMLKIHGSHKNDGLGWGGGSRMASPVYLRVYKVGNGYLPVAVWAKQSAVKSKCPDHEQKVIDFLDKAGFSTWLDGSPL